MCIRLPLCLCSADMEIEDMELGHVQRTHVRGLFQHRNNMAWCTPHTTHCSHLILILAYAEIVSIPFKDHCMWVVHPKTKSGWCSQLLRTCIISKHCCTLPCWWWCEPVHVSIIRSAVLCGSHSGDLVSEPHCSLPESGDTEILATHVSHHDLGGCV